MKKYITCIFIFLTGSVSYGQFLPVPVTTQEQNNWCWAASSKCILNYFGLTGDTVAQCRIVDYARRVGGGPIGVGLGNTPCCIIGYGACDNWNYIWAPPAAPLMRGTIQDIFLHFNNRTANRVLVPLTQAQVATQITANKPFVIRWSTGGIGHFIVGSGLVDNIMSIMDPWYGEGAEINTYAWVANSGVGGHFWNITLTFNGNSCNKPIQGNTTICGGGTTQLTDSIPNGTWASTNFAVATIGTTGLVTGVSAGTTIISYNAACGFVTTTVTVLAGPAAITGSAQVCTGSTTTLANTTGGGTWTSANAGVGTVGSTGIVTGVTAGTVIISYTLGCPVSRTVTVYATPVAITGNTSICAGLTSTLSDVSPGGRWSSSNTAAAGVGSISGAVYGVAPGTANISYTTPTGCFAWTTVTVNASPAAIGGSFGLCTGASTTLTDPSMGGVWTSSNPGIASIGTGTGVVTAGLTVGTATMSYSIAGCPAIANITVSSAPGAFSGPTMVCQGSRIAMTNSGGPGTWTSADDLVASVGRMTGIVTGINPGTTIITYSNGCGARVTTAVTVNPVPAAITGGTNICPQTTSTLLNATGGGAWSSSNMAVGSIGSTTGIVGGVGPGTCTITYTAGGCAALTTVTVNPAPPSNPITGSANICMRGYSVLRNTTAGGIWTSSDNTVAYPGSTAGITAGVGAGTASITYTVTNRFGCSSASYMVMTVNPIPNVNAITGTPSICYNGRAGTTNLACTTPGGTWSSANTAVITVGSNTGVVTSVCTTFGTASILYTVTNGFGCSNFNLRAIYVVPAPAPITGRTNICVGLQDTLFDAVGHGRWLSTAPAVATIGSMNGIVNGVTAGTAVISYSSLASCGTVTTTINVIAAPAPITGTMTVCIGATTSLANATPGGRWTSGATAVATIGSTGVVTGVAAGTSIITYQLGLGCLSNATVNVTPAPAANTGTTSVCTGSTTILGNTGTGGTWSSSNLAVATVGSGVVTGVTAGTVMITYNVGAGCNAVSSVTVNAAPAAINGLSSVCTGASLTLNDPTTGGAWSSSNTAVATVGSASGIVTGVSAGTCLISYVLSSGCYSTLSITVNATPAGITGSGNLCAGTTTMLSNTTAGGVWTSNNTSAATVDSVSGTVSGVASGIATLSYTLPTGCYATWSVTVNATPYAIAGMGNLCVGSTTTFTDASTGGVWYSSNASVATVVTGTGVVTGISSGTAIISYALGSGCAATLAVTVNPVPAPISGVSGICIGASFNFTDATTGGIWSSSNLYLAGVGSASGVVTGVAAGPATLSYTLPTGCYAIWGVTVNPTPYAITGVGSICAGTYTSFTDATTGGTWSSSNTSVSTVGLTGVVIGVSAGTAIISYTVGTGCTVMKTVSVNAAPAPIVGVGSICTGASYTFTDSTTGGLWTSSNTSAATVGLSTGIVAGVAASVATISYSISGCYAIKTVTVVSSPSAISGAGSLCAGTYTSFTDATTGGTWSSSNPAIASVGLTGVVSGVSAGAAVISYTVGTGCTVMKTVSVNAAPAPIVGVGSICTGASYTFTDSTSGGVWTSSNTSAATVGLSTGIVAGVTASVATISYSISGCYAIKTVTVVSSPSAISGAGSLCAGTYTSFTDATTGGTWSSGNPAIASVGLTGVVSGVSAGVAVISYTVGTGCTVIKTVTVNAAPAPIMGVSSICTGASYTFSDSTSGGVWTSSNTSAATVGLSTGIVAGETASVATISYSISVCYAIKTVTVVSSPSAISGAGSLCAGTYISFTDATTGGTWSSSNTSVSTVGLTGVVIGVSAGTAVISYTVGTGCTVMKTVTVNAAPAPVAGVSSICTGASYTFTDSTSGGVWTSSNTSATTVGLSTGIVTGVAASVATISYSISGCYAIKTVTVVSSPSAISGAGSLCAGTYTSFTDATTGGTWSSSNPAIASVGLTGVVSGVSAGATVISYTVGTGCTVMKTVSVNAAPAPIVEVSSICTGASYTFTDSTSGGVWTSSNTSAATVGLSTGVVAGVTASVATISYSISGCYAIKTVTVVSSPSAISGAGSLCAGTYTSFTDATTGGTWSSGNPAIASVGLTGVVSGVSAGVAVISYTVGTGCTVIKAVTVNATPAPIVGVGSICTGASYTFTDSTSGGVWTSSNTSAATVGLSTGIVTGVAASVATISYGISGCYAIKTLTVVSSPSAISGAGSLCAGTYTSFTDATTGGTWSSGNPAIASVGLTGVVNGVSAGVAVISYTVGTGCTVMKTVSVNVAPAPIVGGSSICTGASYTFTDSTSGGVWTSSNTSAATVGLSTGVVAGVTASVATISYSISGCYAIKTVTVVSSPSAISGISSICAGTTTTFSDATSGGTWSSSYPAVATVSSGIVTGVSAGAAVISYTVGTGCTAVKAVSVNAAPAPMSGTSSICSGDSTTLTDSTSGGSWSSSNIYIANVNASTGIVSGVAAGIAYISYSVLGCSTTTTVSVGAAPYFVSGYSNLCTGASATFYDATSGGAWSSSNTSIVSVNSYGLVTGVAAGGAVISYTVSGCSSTLPVTVHSTPDPISGLSSMLTGETYTFSDGTSGGAWSSSNTSAASINASTGYVTGLAYGITYILYTGSDGCTDSLELYVSATSIYDTTGRFSSGSSNPGNALHNIALMPNPNKGEFTLSGSTDLENGKAIPVIITDMLGRVVYAGNVPATNGDVHAGILLNNTLANGMYLLTIDPGNENKTIHFVLER